MWWGTGLGLSLGVLLLMLSRPVAGVFSADPEVVTATADLLVWLALVQPLAAIAFTLDGILIGASDTRFLAAAMAASSVLYVALALFALERDWGTGGLAAGMTVWLVARVTTTGARWRGERWATV
jgi:Na+-driven multidrug efflux pump